MRLIAISLMLLILGSVEGYAQHDKAELANILSIRNGAKIVETSSEHDILKAESIINHNFQDSALWRMKYKVDSAQHTIIALNHKQTITTFSFNTQKVSESKYPGICANYIEIYTALENKEDAYKRVGTTHLKRYKNHQIVTVKSSEAKFVKIVIGSNYGHKKMVELGRVYAYNDAVLHEFETILNAAGKLNVYDINFESNSSKIQDGANISIEIIALLLFDHKDMSLLIEGHTDNEGHSHANVHLSKLRAKEVYHRLIDLGIDKSRLKFAGKGDKEPIASNDTEEGKAKNRRVTFKMINE